MFQAEETHTPVKFKKGFDVNGARFNSLEIRRHQAYNNEYLGGAMAIGEL